MLHDKGHLSANGAVIDVEPWFLQKLEVKSWLASQPGRTRTPARHQPARPPRAPQEVAPPGEVAVRSPQVRPDKEPARPPCPAARV